VLLPQPARKILKNVTAMSAKQTETDLPMHPPRPEVSTGRALLDWETDSLEAEPVFSNPEWDATCTGAVTCIGKTRPDFRRMPRERNFGEAQSGMRMERLTMCNHVVIFVGFRELSLASLYAEVIFAR